MPPLRFSEQRNNHNYDQLELAELLNVHRTTISKYETGQLELSYAGLIKIANFYNVSIDYLLGNSDNPIKEEILPKDELQFLRESLEAYRRAKKIST